MSIISVTTKPFIFDFIYLLICILLCFFFLINQKIAFVCMHNQIIKIFSRKKIKINFYLLIFIFIFFKNKHSFIKKCF